MFKLNKNTLYRLIFLHNQYSCSRISAYIVLHCSFQISDGLKPTDKRTTLEQWELKKEHYADYWAALPKNKNLRCFYNPPILPIIINVLYYNVEKLRKYSTHLMYSTVHSPTILQYHGLVLYIHIQASIKS